MTQLEKERFIGLEWLRFLLGCYVMIYHTTHHYPQFNAVFGLGELTSMGFFATNAFFVLSGFLLTHVYVRGRGLREPASHFWRKRLFNLYPIHIVALVSSMLVVTFMQWLAIPPKVPARQSGLWCMTPMKFWARRIRNCSVITWITCSWRSTASYSYLCYRRGTPIS